MRGAADGVEVVAVRLVLREADDAALSAANTTTIRTNMRTMRMRLFIFRNRQQADGSRQLLRVMDVKGLTQSLRVTELKGQPRVRRRQRLTDSYCHLPSAYCECLLPT